MDERWLHGRVPRGRPRLATKDVRFDRIKKMRHFASSKGDAVNSELLFNPVRIAIILAGAAIMFGVLILRKWRADHWYIYSMAGTMGGLSLYDHFITGLEASWIMPVLLLFMLSMGIYLHVNHRRGKKST